MLRSPSDELAVLRTSSLATAVEREVERLILSGSFAPGERINEFKLASVLGTSRGPIREAIRALEGSGLIISVRNRGSFIRRLSVQEVREVYEIRSALFGLAGKLLAKRVTADQLQRLNRFVAEMEEASSQRNFEAYYPLNLAFHEFIVDSAGNAMLAQQYRSFVKKLHLFRARSLVQGGGLAVSNEEHREIVAAIAARDPAWAHEAHWRHVTSARDRLLSVVETDPPHQSSIKRSLG
ncbi:FCD domain-containing protein [Microvirga sp. BT689]|jgi:DNA-binding GntR family transcriptional regulator|uniref:FCD domain-containing protein n=1 Tax=Microvirga arvi TaxID=2778731 RepID=UPI00194E2AD8|nr:FCD domain-containing protein [Microvirga arvi]MBM6583689.1 FCD domain-containing protein [Microvirga arvi]